MRTAKIRQALRYSTAGHPCAAQYRISLQVEAVIVGPTAMVLDAETARCAPVVVEASAPMTVAVVVEEVAGFEVAGKFKPMRAGVEARRYPRKVE